MATQIFFVFLVICELAILGLLIWGIIAKVRHILKSYYLTLDDQNDEHHVPFFDHPVEAVPMTSLPKPQDKPSDVAPAP